ncbi:MAG TPA: hypothetical protein VJI75_02420 [Candidatus Nanoarchaeia archaeon]|nr:hypothetical protein [Candidatus Nanoarchaeia archaeon]
MEQSGIAAEESAYDTAAQAYAQEQRIISNPSLRYFADIFIELGTKALFITSVPLYWFILFNYALGWFDLPLFVFVVLCSYAFSLAGKGWGALDWLSRAHNKESSEAQVSDSVSDKDLQEIGYMTIDNVTADLKDSMTEEMKDSISVDMTDANAIT